MLLFVFRFPDITGIHSEGDVESKIDSPYSKATTAAVAGDLLISRMTVGSQLFEMIRRHDAHRQGHIASEFVAVQLHLSHRNQASQSVRNGTCQKVILKKQSL